MLMSCLLKVPGPVCAPHEPLWEIGCLVARWEKLGPVTAPTAGLVEVEVLVRSF